MIDARINDEGFIAFHSIHLNAKDILLAHKNVTHMALKNCTSDDWLQIAQTIASMEKLQTLSLWQCNTGDYFLAQLHNSKSLLRLSIKECSITNEGVKHLAQVKSLEELEITDKEAMTIDAYRYIFKSMKHLKRLEMRQPDITKIYVNDNISDAQLRILVKNLPGLTSLNINRNPIGDQGVDILVEGLPLLHCLQISNTKVTEKGLRVLCRSLKLAVLWMGYNKYGDEGGIIVARHLFQLQTLWIYQCQFGWESVTTLCNNLIELVTLDCSNNPEICQGCVALGKLPKLKELYVNNTELKSQTAMTLAKQLRRLQDLNISKSVIIDVLTVSLEIVYH